MCSYFLRFVHHGRGESEGRVVKGRQGGMIGVWLGEGVGKAPSSRVGVEGCLCITKPSVQDAEDNKGWERSERKTPKTKTPARQSRPRLSRERLPLTLKYQ